MATIVIRIPAAEARRVGHGNDLIATATADATRQAKAANQTLGTWAAVTDKPTGDIVITFQAT
jgi:hypothetical protein